MIRKTYLFVLIAAFSLTVANQASAQIIVPTLPQLPKVQAERFKEIERMQAEQLKELERILEQVGQRPAGGRIGSGMQWGGVRLEKPSVEMHTDLGLGENEGLVVTAVGPNSSGEKAGLKAKDVLVKIGDKSVPSDAAGFTKLVKDQKPTEPVDLVVVRNGKEETLKGAKMPALVQSTGGAGGRGGVPGIPGIVFPRIQFNPRVPNNPFGAIQNLHLEMTVNGAKIVRKQNNEQFSGEYSKDDLKITVSGKMENGQAKPSEITVTQGKETKKYASLREVTSPQHRIVIQQLLPSAANNLMLMPLIPNLPELPELLPVVPAAR